jgi:hypothetical protein
MLCALSEYCAIKLYNVYGVTFDVIGKDFYTW